MLPSAGTLTYVLPAASRIARIGRGRDALEAAPVLVPPPAYVAIVFGAWVCAPADRAAASASSSVSPVRRMNFLPKVVQGRYFSASLLVSRFLNCRGLPVGDDARKGPGI